MSGRPALYGPVCAVVWEGRSREAPDYPDPPASTSTSASIVRLQSLSTEFLLERRYRYSCSAFRNTEWARKSLFLTVPSGISFMSAMSW